MGRASSPPSGGSGNPRCRCPRRRWAGLILLDMESSESLGGRMVLYARCPLTTNGVISSARWPTSPEWATRRGLSVDEVVTEVGSAMNPKRRKRPRRRGRRVLVADEGEVDDETRSET